MLDFEILLLLLLLLLCGVYFTDHSQDVFWEVNLLLWDAPWMAERQRG
jgi:hypothetical protein